MKKEFTATVYLLDNQRVLLLYHAKLQKWLPPGGHVELDETPAEAARREVFEETGLEFEFHLQENVYVNYWNAKSIERPYMCLLENIPEYRDTPSHQHVDFIFVGKPIVSEQTSQCSYRWFDWEDLMQLQPDIEVFRDTLDVIKHLFKEFSLSNSLVVSL